MDEFISPIDGHRHFGDTGRDVCAVCCLEAERNQLRDEWCAVRAQYESHIGTLTAGIRGLERMLADVEAERNRLRAVVDAAREVRRLHEARREVEDPADWNDESERQDFSRRLARATVATSDALDVMSDRLDQLDVSPDMSGPTGGERYLAGRLNDPEYRAAYESARSADDAVYHTGRGHYLSTYCFHERHGDCRLTCKGCEAPCRCACHRNEPELIVNVDEDKIDGGYVASIPTRPGVVGQGESPTDAIADLTAVITAAESTEALGFPDDLQAEKEEGQRWLAVGTGRPTTRGG